MKEKKQAKRSQWENFFAKQICEVKARQLNERKVEDKMNEKIKAKKRKIESPSNKSVVMMSTDVASNKAEEFISQVMIQFGENLQSTAIDMENRMNKRFDQFTYSVTNAMTNAITSLMSALVSSMQNSVQTGVLSTHQPRMVMIRISNRSYHFVPTVLMRRCLLSYRHSTKDSDQGMMMTNLIASIDTISISTTW